MSACEMSLTTGYPGPQTPPKISSPQKSPLAKEQKEQITATIGKALAIIGMLSILTAAGLSIGDSSLDITKGMIALGFASFMIGGCMVNTTLPGKS